MTTQLETFKIIDLPRGGLVPLAAAAGKRVTVLSGRVWITEEGCVDDAFLGSGEVITLSVKGLAVIEALSPARLQLLDSGVIRRGVLNAAWGALTQWWHRQPDPRVSACADCR